MDRKSRSAAAAAAAALTASALAIGVGGAPTAEAATPLPTAATSCAANIAKQLPTTLSSSEVATAANDVCNVKVARTPLHKVLRSNLSGAVTPDYVWSAGYTLTGNVWQTEIDWAYQEVDGPHGTLGYTPVGPPVCKTNYAYGVSITRKQQNCYWYGQIPAMSNGDPENPTAFGTTDAFTVSFIFSGFPASADHALNVATTCYGENRSSSY
ncbi:hypothetical protein AB5J72_10185 [Streptomyces sp. CG1]|uniref:hypothetical protein n=1 Tax=Streptomyces sp. CG1 TaxID=1287523 RepID=UPI0034E22072